MQPIISVRNIGKKYKLGATLGGRNYKTLRDVLTQAAFNPFRKLSAAFRKEPSTSGSHSPPNNLITQSHNNPITQSPNNSVTNSPNNPKEFWALKDISFDVQQGEVVGIIGANGAGKSTLLKILSEITEPTEGEIRIRGRVASLLEVGTGFHPELSGRENVYMNGAILGMTKAEIDAKFDEIVAFAEVEKFIDTPVKRYSSGMYVRLAFAVAAHLEPEILLVDEVLAVGDAAFQKKCLGKMGDAAKGGRTVLFVSHNMRAIQRLCPRSLLVDHGQLVLDGNTQQVIERYLSAREESKTENNSLDSLPRPDGFGELIRFTKCSILDSKGEANNHILFGEPFSIYLEALARSELRDLSIIIGIDSFLEYRITTIASEDGNVFFDTSPAHPLCVQACLDKLALKPGIYLLTLGIRSGSRGLDFLPHVMQIEVAEVSDRGSKPDSGTWGVVHTVAHWKHFDLI